MIISSPAKKKSVRATDIERLTFINHADDKDVVRFFFSKVKPSTAAQVLPSRLPVATRQRVATHGHATKIFLTKSEEFFWRRIMVVKITIRIGEKIQLMTIADIPILRADIRFKRLWRAFW